MQVRMARLCQKAGDLAMECGERNWLNWGLLQSRLTVKALQTGVVNFNILLTKISTMPVFQIERSG